MSNELEQRALDNAADDHDRRHTPVEVYDYVREVERVARQALYYDQAGNQPYTPDVDVLAEVRALCVHELARIDRTGALDYLGGIVIGQQAMADAVLAILDAALGGES